MSEKQPWFVTERALALASLMLTSRRDVRVRSSPKEDLSIDILAEVLKDQVPVGRFFGVQVNGQLDLPGVKAIARNGRALNRKQLREFTIPLCVFLFDVRENHGFYRWFVEPIVSDGTPRLRCEGDSEWQALDEQEIGCIVDRVDVWYDALARQLSPGLP